MAMEIPSFSLFGRCCVEWLARFTRFMAYGSFATLTLWQMAYGKSFLLYAIERTQ